MSAPLVLSPEIGAEIQKIVEYAFKNEFSKEDLIAIKDGDAQAPGDLYGFSLFIPFAYKVVFTIQNDDVIRCRHISITDEITHNTPNFMVIEEILRLFGFVGSWKKPNYAYIETDKQVFHVLERIESANLTDTSIQGDSQ